MPGNNYQIRQCERAGCELRYPVLEGHPYGVRCPRCRGSTRLVLTARIDHEIGDKSAVLPGVHLEALLDNIRSAWNVGAMFRTADGLGLRKLHLCGVTPLPDNPKVLKTSLGAEKVVAWQYIANGVQAAIGLREAGYRLWALELTPQAQVIDEARQAMTEQPTVIVVGNEICGVDPGILAQCERVIYLPMVGAKRSFNVAIAFGIAAYALLTTNRSKNGAAV